VHNKPDSRPGTTGPGGGNGPEPRAAVSIRDVAEAAGVSMATVSRVINTPSVVAAATLARVQAVVQRLGYVPNAFAQVLTAGESRVIGVALPWFHGEFFSRMLQGADQQATKLGYHLLITSITTKPDGSRRDRVLGTGLIDGMIVMVDDAHDPLVEDVVKTALPCVSLDLDLSSRGKDSVVLDNERGTKEAVEHLLRWVEPSRCVFVGGPKTNFDTQHRATAFEQVMRRSGHEPSAEQVAYGEYSVAWGKEWAVRAHARGRLTGAAILAGNDEIACGILRAAEAAHVWVPDQLRIIGFDDTRLAQSVRPTLSSVALPMEEVGVAAVEMLVRRIENRDAPATCIRLATKLVVRESSTAMTF